MNSTTSFSGVLSAKVTRNHRKAPLLWRIQNGIRPSFWLGWIVNMLAVLFSRLTGVPTMIAELRAVKVGADGVAIDYGVLSYRVVTSAGVAFLVDDWDSDATDITTMNYHASGTGTGAEASSDTGLEPRQLASPTVPPARSRNRRRTSCAALARRLLPAAPPLPSMVCFR